MTSFTNNPTFIPTGSVLKSVETPDLAHEVARLKARFVIKDTDKADE